MGKRIPFGEPQNESERWAFDFLERELPDDIEFLTNIEVLSESGQPFEVDAIVLGPWAIHFIDVKGYYGSVRADTSAWELDGRQIENPLPKANHVARMFAARMLKRLPHGAIAPWCQGGAFLTGVRGEGISLVKGDPNLCVWDPGQIVKALTSVEHVTSSKKFPITPEQWSQARDVAGQTEAALRRASSIGDFLRKKKLMQNGGSSVWLAEYQQPGLTRHFLLKLLDPSGFQSHDRAAAAESRLRTEASMHMQLAGLPGIPYVAPLIENEGLLALPIRMPAGQPLSRTDPDSLTTEQRLKTLRAAGAALQGIHDRGLVHGKLNADTIYVSDAREVEFLDIGADRNGDADTDKQALADAFRAWFDDTVPAIVEWLNGESHDLERLRRAIVDSLNPVDFAPTELVPVELEPDAIVADHFRLLEEYRREGDIHMWRARHRIGRFDCALLISEQGEAGLERVKSEFELLGRVFHPNICRVFEVGSIDQQRHFIARAWVPGRSLAGLIRDDGRQPEASLTTWLRQAAAALEYLHANGITHRGLCPAAIMIDGDDLVLVDLGMSDPEDNQSGAVVFRDPRVIEHGWTEQADLYALSLTLLCAAAGEPAPPLQTAPEWPAFRENALKQMPKALQSGVQEALDLFPTGLPGDYLDFFGLAEEQPPLTELPDDFRAEWGISKGYMEFLVVDMLNDGRARSRKQWVLNALRSRRIAGNKVNYSSMNSTVSRLISAGVAEKHRTKVRLTKKFVNQCVSFPSQHNR